MQTLNSPGEMSSAPERPEAVAALAAEAVAGDGLGPTAPPAPALPGVMAGGGQSVARNTLIMFAQQMVTFAMTFVWTVAVQWYLGPDHYGQLFYAQSLAWIGAVFIDAGVTTYLTKQVARDRAHTRRLLSNALVLRTASGVLVYAAILGVAWGMGKHDDVFLAVALVALGILAASFTQAAAATFQGHETMLWPALGTIAEKVAVALFSVTLLLLGYGLLAVAAVLFCGAAINLLIVGTRALRAGWVRPQIDPAVMRTLLIGGAPFFLWAAFGVIYQRNAAIQLEAQDPSSEGVFGVAVRMYETLSFVPYIFQVAILPVLARTFVQAQELDDADRAAQRRPDHAGRAADGHGRAAARARDRRAGGAAA